MKRFPAIHFVSVFICMGILLAPLSAKQKIGSYNNLHLINQYNTYSGYGDYNGFTVANSNRGRIFTSDKKDMPLSKISLKQSFLGPLKFKTEYNKGENIFTFTGLSLTDKFTQTISAVPEAMEEAKGSIPFNALSFVGSVAMLVLAFSDFVGTMQDANRVSRGELPADDSGLDIVPFVLSLGVMTIGSVLARNHIKKSVHIYNNQITKKSTQGTAYPINHRQLKNDSRNRFLENTGRRPFRWVVFQMAF